jgi:hypothetical protein
LLASIRRDGRPFTKASKRFAGLRIERRVGLPSRRAIDTKQISIAGSTGRARYIVFPSTASSFGSSPSLPMTIVGVSGLRGPVNWSGAERTVNAATTPQSMANRLLPGSRVYNHWLWRYTIVWTKLLG